jgi:hypothetical protein
MPDFNLVCPYSPDILVFEKENVFGHTKVTNKIALQTFMTCLYKNDFSNFILCICKNKTSLKNGVFWDVTLCGSCKNRRFGGT